MQINSNTLQAFREDFKSAIEELEKKYNVSIDLGRITYNETNFSGKIEVTNLEGQETDPYVKYAKYAQAFKSCHDLYGMPESILNKSFKQGNKTYTFIGFDLAKRKNFCTLVDATGTMFKTTEHVICGNIKNFK